jgi:hypothetical protein
VIWLLAYPLIGLLMIVGVTWSQPCASWREAGRLLILSALWPVVLLSAVLTMLDDSQS